MSEVIVRMESERTVSAMKSTKPFPLCDDYIELPIKKMYCRGEIIADELQADGTLIKRTCTIEELNNGHASGDSERTR